MLRIPTSTALLGIALFIAAVGTAQRPAIAAMSPPEVRIKSIRLAPNDSVQIEFNATESISLSLELQKSEDLSATSGWSFVETLEPSQTENGRNIVVVPRSDGTRFFRIQAKPTNHPQTTTVLINEVMSNNDTILAAADGMFYDWIELYNYGETEVSLTGLHLSDNPQNLQKWSFPDLTIASGAFSIVFASGNTSASAGEVHTNFRLSSDGEVITLSGPTQGIIDSVSVGRLDNDQALGRLPQNPSVWGLFEASNVTANQPNLDVEAIVVEQPRFATVPGFHDSPIELTITSPASGNIHFTLDGSTPDQGSTPFSVPIQITETTVVRAIHTDSENRSSAILTGTFFIAVDHELAVVSIAAPPENFDIKTGYLYGFGAHMFSRGQISANFPFSGSNAWKDREIGASFEFFTPERNPFQQDVGLKVFGGWGSRGYPQKSLAVFARSRYGTGKIRYPLFPDTEIDEFESFILRNSGNDNQSTHHIHPRPPISEFGATASNGSYFVNGTFTLFRDAMMGQLVKHLNVDTQAYRPTVVYINGDYWGIYNLREKLNEHFVESHHGVPSDRVDLIEGYGQANAGSNQGYNQMWAQFNRSDLSIDANYERLKDTFVDIDSFTDYHLSVIYFQNFDIGNIKCWRNQENGKFRWMLYDQDYGFNLWPAEVYIKSMARDYSDYANMFDFYTNGSGTSTGWPNSGGRTLMLRKLLNNQGFKEQFIQRCANLLNIEFDPERVASTIDRLASGLRQEIPAHLERWSWASLEGRNFGIPFSPEDNPLTEELWEANINILHEFARTRPDQLRRDLIDHFSLSKGIAQLNIALENPTGGVVTINGGRVPEGGLVGKYFADYPTVLAAQPNPGFTFRKWILENQSVLSPQLSLELSDGQSQQVRAVFEAL